jgi:hypothetical protein
MLQKKLNVLQFSSVYVAQLRTRPTKIVRSEMIKLNPSGTVPNDIPDYVLGDSSTP